MKKYILYLSIILAIVAFSSCNYNGEGTIIVKNTGPLTIMAEVQYSSVRVGPGGETEFKLTWPGHDDMHTNLLTYPTAFRTTMGKSESIWISHKETLTFEVAYYPPEN